MRAVYLRAASKFLQGVCVKGSSKPSLKIVFLPLPSASARNARTITRKLFPPDSRPSRARAWALVREYATTNRVAHHATANAAGGVSATSYFAAHAKHETEGEDALFV